MSEISIPNREAPRPYTPMKMEHFFSADELEIIERIRAEFLQGISIDSIQRTLSNGYVVSYNAPHLIIRVSNTATLSIPIESS